MLISLCLIACAAVEFDRELPELHSLVLNIENDEVESARVLLSRTINELHYSYKIEKSDTHDVGVGEYCATAFNCIDTLYDMREIDDFAANFKNSLKKVRVYSSSIPDDKLSEKLELGNDKIIDLAPSYSVISCSDPFYHSFIKTRSDTMSFKLKDITMSLDVTVPVSTAEDVTIDRIIGCITGIPSFIYLMDAEVDRSLLAKSYFRMEDDGTGLYTANLHPFGLFLHENEEYISGNGIVYLYIYASTDNISNVFHIACNLKKLFGNDVLMTPTATDGHYIINLQSKTIKLNSDIHISKNNVTIKDDSCARWIDGEEFNLDDSLPFVPII